MTTTCHRAFNRGREEVPREAYNPFAFTLPTWPLRPRTAQRIDQVRELRDVDDDAADESLRLHAVHIVEVQDRDCHC